jgi:hypothetical protein
MMSSSDDPFSLVYNALWDLLEASPEFEDAVREKNRVKFVGSNNRSPIKDRVQTADLPEVRIVPTTIFPHIQRSSTSSSVDITFEIQTSTGEQVLDQPLTLFPVQWCILMAMSNWELHLKQLTWHNDHFVKLAKPTEASLGVSDDDLNRGVKGWSAVWACSMQLWFTTTYLQGE